MQRRQILMAGGAAAVVAFGAGAWKIATPSLAKASEPWRAAGAGFGDARLNALSYAILAPNPHNRQPWQFELVGDDRIDVTCDLGKRLPSTDPLDRQITIGFGCMLELLRQAAAEAGYTAQVTGFPDGEGQPRLDARPVARVVLVADRPAKDPLHAQVLARRSTKEPYLDQPVEDAAMEALGAVVSPALRYGFSRSDSERAAIAANAWEAWTIEQNTPATRRESIELMRIGNDAVVAQPDGIDMGGAFLSTANALGILTPETLDTPGSRVFEEGFAQYRGMVDSTPRWAWIASPGNSRAEQLQAGASWVRLNLAAQAQGLAVHPWSHALQEFPQMEEPFRALRRMIAPDGGTVQMFARVGYGPEVPASPRWPLEVKLIDG